MLGARDEQSIDQRRSHASAIESIDEFFKIKLLVFFPPMVGTINELLAIADQCVHPLEDFMCVFVTR